MKFRLILNSTTKKGHPVQIKFNVPPSKHLGLINFLKIATENENDVELAIEKIEDGKSELSKVHGIFKLIEESTPSKTDE
ncbi:MAG: hypothetical protein ACTSVZ_09625 [Promethearchaeota archaeon]